MAYLLGNYVSAKPVICWVLLKKVLALLMETARRNVLVTVAYADLLKMLPGTQAKMRWWIKTQIRPDMVTYTFNPSSWEVDADRSLGFEASLVYISKF